MKNRRLTIVAFLLCACLIVGFGYALVSDTLRIDGTATINHSGATSAFDGLVYFKLDDDEKTRIEKAGDSLVLSGQDDIATVTVNSLTLKDTYATFTLKVVNDYDHPIYVTPKIDESSSLFDKTLISISSDWLSKTHEIASKTSRTYTLTVKCVEPKEATTSFAIGFTAIDVLEQGAEYVPATETNGSANTATYTVQ